MTSHASLVITTFAIILPLYQNSCETTTSGFSSWRFRGHTTKQLGKCAPASPSSPQTSSRHSFRFGFVDDWNYTISIKDSKSATHCNCKKTLRNVYIYMCIYIYIHIDINTNTKKHMHLHRCTIYIVLWHLICQCCFQKIPKNIWHLSSD